MLPGRQLPSPAFDPLTFGSLRRRLGTLSFVDEFVPFAVLFTLWFDDNGVTIAQLSVAFVVWALCALALEIPSGVVADRTDRRKLIGTALLIRAAGTVVWLIWPTWTGLLIGTFLWAVHDAAANGAWEAMIHDHLVAVGANREYGVMMARLGQFSHLGLAAAALVSIPALGGGISLAAIGWLTVVLTILPIGILASLPDVRWVVDESREAAEDGGSSGSGMWVTIRSATRDRSATIAILVGSMIAGLAIIDEYVPLLARRRGVSDAWVPLVFIGVWIGLLVGGEIAARHPDLTARRMSAFLLTGAALTLTALLLEPVWALVGIAVGYASIETAWVVADARLQRRVPAHVRATVTSVRELGGGLIVTLALLAIGATARDDDPTPGLIGVAVAMTATGLVAILLPDE